MSGQSSHRREGACSQTSFLERGALYPTHLVFVPVGISPFCLSGSKVSTFSHSYFLPTLPPCPAFTLSAGPQ